MRATSNDPELPRWRWTVEYTEYASGTILRDAEDAGIAVGESAGHALEWLLRHGPFWDMADDAHPLTISIRPATDTTREG